MVARWFSFLSWREVLLLGVPALLLFAAACGAPDAPPAGGGAAAPDETRSPVVEDEAAALDDSGSGGTLRVGMSAANVPIPNTPPSEGGEGSRFVGYQVYDGLLNWDLKNAADSAAVPGPGLAETWTTSEDGLTWTLNLRQGVKFHDGTDFNADAVVFQLDRVTNSEFEYYDPVISAANSSTVALIDSYEKVDDFTVNVTTNDVWSFMPYEFVRIMIPSPTAVMEWGNDEYAQHAVGTGPFKVARYIDGQVMELEANEEYWGGRPKLDRIELYPMPEPATRLAALQSGQINWAEVPPPDAFQQLQGQGFNILLKPYPHVITYQLNTYKAPFDDVRVRQALNYAMDREGVCTALLNGLCIPARQYVPPGHQWYDPEFEGYAYDPERAKQLLTEAGYPDGFEMVIAYPPGGSGNMWPGLMNEKLQQDLAAVGIEVKLQPIEWNNIISGYRAGFKDPAWSSYDAIHISLGASGPTTFGLQFYTTGAIPPDGCCNASGYSNPEFDALFDQARTTFDIEQQYALFRQMQSMMTADAPFIITVHDLNFRVLAPNVRGFVMAQSWSQDLTEVWVAE